MEWRIEAAKATPATELGDVLRRARDEWARTTPQESKALSSEYVLLDSMIADKYDANRRPYVEQKAAKVLADSATLDAGHRKVVAQMDAGIAAALALVATMPPGTHVRASVAGHWFPGHGSHLDERLSVDVDQCRPPVPESSEP